MNDEGRTMLALLALTALCIAGALFSIGRLNDDGALPEAGPRVMPSPQGLTALLKRGPEGAEGARQGLLEVDVVMDHRLIDSFHDNLKNIAPQQGWHAASLATSRLELTLPAQDIGQLNRLANQPVAWIREHHRPGGRAKPPASEELVTVRLDIHGQKWPVILWFMSLIVTGITAVVAACLLVSGAVLNTREALARRADRRDRANAMGRENR